MAKAIAAEEFPIGLEKMVENIGILKRGLVASCSPNRVTHSQYSRAKRMFGSVFARLYKEEGRLFYVWKGSAAKMLPEEISVYIENGYLSLLGPLICRIVAKDPVMMNTVLQRLFRKFPPTYEEKLLGKQQVTKDGITMFFPYLG